MYSLLRSVFIVKSIDNSSFRINVFEDIANQNSLIRFAYIAYNNTAKTPLGAILLILYGLKCYLSLKLPTQKKTDLVCFASYPNEHKTIEDFKKHLSCLHTQDISINKKNILCLSNLKALIIFILNSPRLYTFARKSCCHLHFMPACRIFSTVTYYLRFTHLLQSINAPGVLVAHNYSPECTAFASAAHRQGKKVIYMNHAHIPSKTPFVAPLLADLAILTSAAVVQRLAINNVHTTNPILIGYEIPRQALRINLTDRKELTVGIFLSALINKQYVQQLIKQLQQRLPRLQILIRLHPVASLYQNFSAIKKDQPMIQISKNNTLLTDIKKCDLAICGDTSAIIEILKSGCPVVYDKQLDNIPEDYNGFVQGGLVYALESLDENLFSHTTDFYSKPEWKAVMQFYDPSYQYERKKLLLAAEQEITRVLQSK